MKSKLNLRLGLFLLLLIVVLSGCSVTNQTMKQPNYHIEFYKNDFEYSNQVAAEAKSVRILGIDWSRLFKWQTGEILPENYRANTQDIAISGSIVDDFVAAGMSTLIPVLGEQHKGKVSAYALYNLMQENPGYDIVIYPQYETKHFIIPIFYSKRTAKVTARLGKIK